MQKVVYIVVTFIVLLVSAVGDAAADNEYDVVLTSVAVNNHEGNQCDVFSDCDFRWEAKACKGEEKTDQNHPTWSVHCGGFEIDERFRFHLWDVNPVKDTYYGYCTMTVTSTDGGIVASCWNNSWDADLKFVRVKK